MQRFITVAIHTFDKANALRALLENEGITVEFLNVNLETPGVFSGVRIRIPEDELAHALRIIENRELFAGVPEGGKADHSILVPVDLSEQSYKAVTVAAHLAAHNNNSITLLYSYIDPYITSNVQLNDTLRFESGEKGARELLFHNAEKLLSHFRERLLSDMKRGLVDVVKVRTHVSEGVPEDAIIEYARNSKPRMIVMSTRGAEKKEKEMIGSVTAEVLDDGRFMVLTVPEPVEKERSITPKSILFVSNLDQDDILAMDAMYRIYGSSEASVTIVHMPKRHRFSERSADKALNALSQYCRENFRDFHFVTVPVNRGDTEKAFASLDNEYKFDLVVIPNRHRNAVSRLFNPGIAHKLLFQMDIPLMVIPV